MKILYHPKRLVGFETYCAPSTFNRKTQPVDIYDVFEKYYRHHRTAKWILSASDSFTPYSFYSFALSANEMPMPLYEGAKSGASFVISSETGGIRTTTEIPVTHYIGTIADGYYNSIQVESTDGYPDSGKISLGNYTYYNASITTKGFFQYDSVDRINHIFYWSGAAQRVNQAEGEYGKIVMPVASFGSSTKRYVIGKNTNSNMQSFEYYANGYPSPIYGAEWLYCGDRINQIATSSANAGPTTIKYIHIHKLDNITTYGYGTHRNGSLTGTLHISRTPALIGKLTFAGNPISGELVIPSNILTIEDSAFWACTGLTSLIFETGINTIGTYAFNSCSNLNGTLEIPTSCLTIGDSAFISCNKLDVLILNEGLQSIGISAFQSCTQLSGTLDFPDTLTTIGKYAFLSCTGFTGTLTITSGITSIGEGAFGDDNFDDIGVSANAGYHDHDDVLYQESTHTALHSVKSNNGTITFESDTLIIGEYCCYNDSRTGALAIPNQVTTINYRAFRNCFGITSLTFTATPVITAINQDAFYNCSGINGTLTIPDSLTTLGTSAFYGCTAIDTLTIGGSSLLSTIGAYAFYNCAQIINNISFTTTLRTIGTYAFHNCPITGTLNIPAGVTSIGAGAFTLNNLDGFTSDEAKFTVYDYVLYDEATVGQIKALASARAYSGTLTLKTGTTSILLGCFQNNDNRNGAVLILYTVTSIGENAFSKSNGLNSTITIGDAINGSSLIEIGKFAFINCPNITGYNIYRTPAPTCNSSFSADAKPLHIKTGATGYDVTPATDAAPWTNTAIFSPVNYDL